MMDQSGDLTHHEQMKWMHSDLIHTVSNLCNNMYTYMCVCVCVGVLVCMCMCVCVCVLKGTGMLHRHADVGNTMVLFRN